MNWHKLGGAIIIFFVVGFGVFFLLNGLLLSGVTFGESVNMLLLAISPILGCLAGFLAGRNYYNSDAEENGEADKIENNSK